MSGRLPSDSSAAKFQNFDDIRPLSHGSSGKAWLVRGHVDGKQYVLKKAEVLGDKYKAGPTSYALQESRILSLLHHRHIVKQMDFFPKKEHWCIVLEHCDGGDLAAIIKDHRERKRPFADANLFRILHQVGSALAHAHAMGVIHRDIKPANILLRGGDAVVADWGLSHVCTESSDTSAYMGTVIDMAPEVRSKRLYSFPAGIWSLGMVLYECLCLVDLQYVDATKPDVTKLSSNALGFLVRQMLSSDPAFRPTAAQVVAATSQHLSAELAPSSRQAAAPTVAPSFHSLDPSSFRPASTQGASAVVQSASLDSSRTLPLVVSPLSHQNLRSTPSPRGDGARTSSAKSFTAISAPPHPSLKFSNPLSDDTRSVAPTFVRVPHFVTDGASARDYSRRAQPPSPVASTLHHSPSAAASPNSSLGLVLERSPDGHYIVSRVQKRGIAYGALFAGEIIAEVGSISVRGIPMHELGPLLQAAVRNQAPVSVISANGLARTAYLGVPSPFSSHHSEEEEEIDFNAVRETVHISAFGITLKELGGDIVIDSVIIQTPKGFQIDDVLRSVNDVTCSGRSLKQVAGALSGPAGDGAHVSVDRYIDGAWRTLKVFLDAQSMADGFII
jgi:NIMA (never in mitosis gene a)-related kinase